MAESAIPVDLANPGQVFACLGFMEAALVLMPEAEITAAFDWSDRPARFRLRADGADADPVREVLAFLKAAEVVAVVPRGSGLEFESSKWKIAGSEAGTDLYPIVPPEKPERLAACLRGGGATLWICHWGEDRARDDLKFWGGAGGYPGPTRLNDMIGHFRHSADALASDPFSFACPMSSRFRLDWRRDYVPLDAGFSLNAHGNIASTGYPVVEVLAAIGLTHARPMPVRRLEYRYAVPGGLPGVFLPPVFHRAALGCTAAPFPGLPLRRFAMHLGWPTQKGKDRSIINVIEETSA